MKIITMIMLGLLNMNSAFAQGNTQDYPRASDKYGVLLSCPSFARERTIKSLAEMHLSRWAELPRFTTLEEARDFLKKYSVPQFYQSIDQAYNDIIDPSLTDWRERLVIDGSALGAPEKIQDCWVHVLWVKANINSTSANDLKLARAKVYKEFEKMDPVTILFAFLDPELTARDSEFLKILGDKIRFRKTLK